MPFVKLKVKISKYYIYLSYRIQSKYCSENLYLLKVEYLGRRRGLWLLLVLLPCSPALLPCPATLPRCLLCCGRYRNGLLLKTLRG